MRAIIQRSKNASVTVDNKVLGEIEKGFVILLGVTHEDTKEDLDYIVKKITNMRIFEDDNGLMNLSIKDVQGDILSISQFTLYASTKKGNRPGFTNAAKPDFALDMYNKFNQTLSDIGIKVETGEFGADMKVSLINDGPVTIILDSKNKEF